MISASMSATKADQGEPTDCRRRVCSESVRSPLQAAVSAVRDSKQVADPDAGKISAQQYSAEIDASTAEFSAKYNARWCQNLLNAMADAPGSSALHAAALEKLHNRGCLR